MKVTKKMPSFEGVVAGQTATLRLPIGLTFHSLFVAYSGVTLAQMTEIRVIADGKTFQRYRSGTELDTLNQFQGRAAASGVIAIDFDRYNLRTKEAEEITALGTGLSSQDTGAHEISTLALEIDIDGGAASPSLTCHALQSPPSPLGLLRHVRPYTFTAGGAGEFEISEIPKGDIFNQVHFFSGDIDAITIERDGFIAFERSATMNEWANDDGVREPQTDVVSFDPTESGNGGQGLITAGVHDLRFRLEMSGAGSVPTVVEAIAPLPF